MDEVEILLRKHRFLGTSLRYNVASDQPQTKTRSGRTVLCKKIKSDILRSGPLFDLIAKEHPWVEQITVNYNLRCTPHLHCTLHPTAPFTPPTISLPRANLLLQLLLHHSTHHLTTISLLTRITTTTPAGCRLCSETLLSRPETRRPHPEALRPRPGALLPHPAGPLF